MKYICIDTNIFIQCCLLEIEGDNIETIKDLLKLLEEGNVTLLLPEIIKLEFYKVLTKKSNELKKSIGGHKESINRDNSLDDKIKKDLQEKLSECMEERENNADKTLDAIEKIFAHENTINIPLTAEILIEGYKTFLSGKKPTKTKDYPINADAQIIASLKIHLSSEGEYELFFTSNNFTDFAAHQEGNVSSDEAVEIHGDIKKHFSSIKYYTNIFELLKKEFGEDYSEEEIEKAKKKAVNIDDVPPSAFFGDFISNQNSLIQDSISSIPNPASLVQDSIANFSNVAPLFQEAISNNMSIFSDAIPKSMESITDITKASMPNIGNIVPNLSPMKDFLKSGKLTSVTIKKPDISASTISEDEGKKS